MDPSTSSIINKKKHKLLFLFVVFISLVGVKLQVGFDTVYLLSIVALCKFLLKQKKFNNAYQLYLIIFFLAAITLSNHGLWGYTGATMFLIRSFFLITLGFFLFELLKENGYGVHDFRKLLVVAIFLHALIVIGQKISTDFRDFIYSYSVVSDQTLGFFYGIRYPGLMYAGNAVTSTVQALGLVWGVYYFFNTNKNVLFWSIACFTIAISVLLMGRTGFLFFSYCFFLSFWFYRRKLNSIWLAVIVLLLFPLSMPFLSETITWFMSEYTGGGSVTINALSEMAFFSAAHDSFWFYLFGTGSDGRDQFYFPSDIGYARYVLMFGFIGTMLLLYPFVCALLSVARLVLSEQRGDDILLFLIFFFFVFLAPYKEIFIGLKGVTTYLVVEMLYVRYRYKSIGNHGIMGNRNNENFSRR